MLDRKEWKIRAHVKRIAWLDRSPKHRGLKPSRTQHQERERRLKRNEFNIADAGFQRAG